MFSLSGFITLVVFFGGSYLALRWVYSRWVQLDKEEQSKEEQ